MIVPSSGANGAVNVQVVVGRPLTLKPGGATLSVPTVDDVSDPTIATLVLPPATVPSTNASPAWLLMMVVKMTVSAPQVAVIVAVCGSAKAIPLPPRTNKEDIVSTVPKRFIQDPFIEYPTEIGLTMEGRHRYSANSVGSSASGGC